MECPKCHKVISEDATSCPHCHKVLSLVCPNCRTIGHSSVCEKCGYIILEKCSKCGKTVSTVSEKCKCGFPVLTSVAYQECESDEFASVSIEFGALKAVRKLLGSQDLFVKFKTKLKNLITAQVRGLEGCVIQYGDKYVINFNKELSFPTSSNKAIRFALKLMNSLTELNLNVIEELGTPLNITLTIIKKNSEELLLDKTFKTNVKPLSIHKNEKRYLKGTQIVLDENVQDVISKDYKTDSLYTIEEAGKTLVFYEIKLDNYILPPNETHDEEPEKPEVVKTISQNKDNDEEKQDLYSFNVFNIHAKCKFEKTVQKDILSKIGNSKIVSLRSSKELGIKTSDIFKYYSNEDKKVIRVVCSEEMLYKSWGVLEEIYRRYYNLSSYNEFIPKDFKSNFVYLQNLVLNRPRKASTPEDARFAYMDDFVKFLSVLKNTVVIVEGFEYIDDTTLQTLELYFDNYKKINTQFIFVTDEDTPVHSKIKSLLRTPLYTELRLQKNKIDNLVSDMKEDASDFIKSFYYEKIKQNANGSKLYFDNAIQYLKDKDVLVSFENKLLVKNNDSVFLPSEIDELIKARLKSLSKNSNASMILAYLALVNTCLDCKILEKLEVKEVQKSVETLSKAGFVFESDGFIYLNNCSLIKPVIISGMKKNVIEFLSKNILAKIGHGLDNTTTLILMGKLQLFKDEYLLLWKNSSFGIETGDYDAYLKNTRGFMSLIDYIKGNISDEEIEENKKDVYNNILRSLYAYSPDKIYDIEQILLADAIKNEDKDNTVRLSNLMLQGALISGKYGEAAGLLNNILKNMPNPKLFVDGAVNTKFLLLMLVNIEILFNIGDLKSCIEISNELLDVLTPDTIEKIKPASFSMNLFAGHLMDTFRLGALAHLLSLNSNFDTFIEKIKNALGEELPEKDAFYAIKEFLSGKTFEIKNIEEQTPFAKVIYLILQEFSERNIDYKTFAQNIYQAKILSSDIHQQLLEYFCELLIAYAYAKSLVFKKAESIYRDIIEKTELSANINIMLLAKYFLSLLKVSKGETEGGMLIINDASAFIRTNAPDENLMFALFKKLLISTAEVNNLSFIDLETESQKLAQLTMNGELARLV